jgi:hypothetical protein
MSAEPIVSGLFCGCGRRFFPMGVEPGHLAKCPGCGAWHRVPIPGEQETWVASPARRGRRARRSDGSSLRDCLLYPITDGPGVALLVAMPPFVWLMSVPAFDLIRFAWSGPRGTFNPFFLLIAPLAMPLGVCFILTIGYVLLFLGGILVSGAMGEEMHPSWPMWDVHAILEGLGRWLWSGLVGVIAGAFPVILYWKNCGDIDWIDIVILAELSAVGAGYALMALAMALLHETLLATNPVTVLRSIRQFGWAYVRPSIAAATALGLVGLSFYLSLFRSPNLGVAAVSLWGAWVFALYAAMVVLRLFGMTYYRHSDELAWFRARPKWAVWGRQGKIYANS